MDELDNTKVVQSQQPQPFDISKICRACLTEKDEMRSVFAGGNQGMRLAEVLMAFSDVQIESGDGLPALLCVECAQQANQCFSFRQLCEQSDNNLRQYLGKPAIKQKPSDELNAYNSRLLKTLDILNDSDSNEELDKLDTILDLQMNENEIKLVAQKQLIKVTAQIQKEKSSRKKQKATNNSSKTINYKCNACKKQFNISKALVRHLRSHIEDRPFACKLCPRSFSEMTYLNNHMRTHMPEGEKPHECEYCKARFTHETLLKKHMLKHSGSKPFVCKICNKGCYAENSLLKHMKIHERKQGDPALLKHMCDYCKSEFATAQLLADHIKQHSGDRPFLCTICGKCFPQRFNLELHIRTHTGERPFECEICKNGYVSKASLKIHMRTHTNERPFVCDFCGKAFRQSGDLTSHKRLHGTDKPIECSVCQKRFTTVMKLKYHMRNHTGERPYVCNICGRGFTVNTILLRHMRVHSGERPYVCVTCGKAFSQSSTLNTHMKVHASPSQKYQIPPLIINQPNLERVSHLTQVQQNQTVQPTDRLPKFHATHNQVVHAHASQTTQLLLDDNVTAHDHLLGEFKITHHGGDDDAGKFIDSKAFITEVAESRLLVTTNENAIIGDDDRLLNETKFLSNYDAYRGHL